MQKSKTRVTGKRRQKFRENLDKLWDIGASDAIEQIQKNRLMSSADKVDDIAFYMDQGSARKGSIRGRGMVFAEKKGAKKRGMKLRRRNPVAPVAAPSAQALGVVKLVQAWIAVFLLWVIWTRRRNRM